MAERDDVCLCEVLPFFVYDIVNQLPYGRFLSPPKTVHIQLSFMQSSICRSSSVDYRFLSCTGQALLLFVPTEPDREEPHHGNHRCALLDVASIQNFLFNFRTAVIRVAAAVGPEGSAAVASVPRLCSLGSPSH